MSEGRIILASKTELFPFKCEDPRSTSTLPERSVCLWLTACKIFATCLLLLIRNRLIGQKIDTKLWNRYLKILNVFLYVHYDLAKRILSYNHFLGSIRYLITHHFDRSLHKLSFTTVGLQSNCPSPLLVNLYFGIFKKLLSRNDTRKRNFDDMMQMTECPVMPISSK